MTTLATLPDLVILNIFKYLQWPRSRITLDKRYCAICSKWRQLALPIAYSKMYFNQNYFGNYEASTVCWKSNIEKYTNNELKKLVKKVEIHFPNSDTDFDLLIGPLLDKISKCAVVDCYEKSEFDKLEDKMRHILEKFAFTSPNVLHLEIVLQSDQSSARQFTTQLLNAFYSRIQNLELCLGFPLDLEHYPPELQHLDFQFTSGTKFPLPKIRNPEKLKSLYMSSVVNNVAWANLVDIPSGGTSVVFSNLKALSLSYLDEYSDIDTSKQLESLAPTQNLKIQLPQLTELTLISNNAKSQLVFNPDIISSRLEKAWLDISFKDLALSRKLPINSIGKLNLNMDMCKINNMAEFYRTTNRLLGDIDNFGKYTHFVLEGRFDLVDMDRIKWTNVTKLFLAFIDVPTLIKLLAKLPMLESVEIICLTYGANYDTTPLEKSQLKEIDIGRLKRGEWTLDSATEFIHSITRQHRNINKLKLPGDVRERLREMTLDGTNWQEIKLEKSHNIYLPCSDCRSYENDPEDN